MKNKYEFEDQYGAPKRFTHNQSNNTIELDFAGYPKSHQYYIDLDEINEYRHIVAWIIHISQKRWFDPTQTAPLIAEICNIKGWDPESNK